MIRGNGSIASYEPPLSIREINERADNYLAAMQRGDPGATKEIARAIAQLANDLRIPISVGINNISIIGAPGKQNIALSSNLIWALVVRHINSSEESVTFQASFRQDDDMGLTACVAIKRDGIADFSYEFSEADAADAGLLGKSSWESYLRNMLMWRALKFACQIVFPDVISGLYSRDEMGADDDAFDGPCDAGEEAPPMWREVFEHAWNRAADAGVPVQKALEEFSEETGRDPSVPLTDEDMIELTSRLNYATESAF